jgi:hypothetical protein
MPQSLNVKERARIEMENQAIQSLAQAPGIGVREGTAGIIFVSSFSRDLLFTLNSILFLQIKM